MDELRDISWCLIIPLAVDVTALGVVLRITTKFSELHANFVRG